MAAAVEVCHLPQRKALLLLGFFLQALQQQRLSRHQHRPSWLRVLLLPVWEQQGLALRP